MVIDRNVLRVVVRWGKEAVPGVRRLEAIVQDDNCIRDLASLAKPIAIELRGDVPAQGVHVQRRFVQELNTHDDVLELCLPVLLLNGLYAISTASCTLSLPPTTHLEHLESPLYIVAGLPLRDFHSLPRIVISVLSDVSERYTHALQSARFLPGSLARREDQS